jgi:Na+-translocating ferredoxin:NAD+ oxidoreductase subunit C
MLDHLLGLRVPRYQHTTGATTPESLPFLGKLLVPLSNGEDGWELKVKEGDQVKPGQVLSEHDRLGILVSSWQGTIEELKALPDLYGHRTVATAVVADPSEGTGLAGIDPQTASVQELQDRLKEAGLFTSLGTSTALADPLPEPTGKPVGILVVVAVDSDPMVSSTAHLLATKPTDLARATAMLKRLYNCQRAVLAVPSPNIESTRQAASAAGIDVLGVPVRYPSGLPDLVANSAGTGAMPIAAVTALQALAAVEQGTLPTTVTLSLIGPDRKTVRLVSVPIGTPVQSVLKHAGITINELDKVVAGGPMRGIALPETGIGVSAGMTALTVIPANDISPWTNEPCINCGSCIRACPVNLQPHLLGKCAEYDLFSQAGELSIEACLECGLCAAVCPAHRPLVQWIRLARAEEHKRLQQEVAQALEQAGIPESSDEPEEALHD